MIKPFERQASFLRSAVNMDSYRLGRNRRISLTVRGQRALHQQHQHRADAQHPTHTSRSLAGPRRKDHRRARLQDPFRQRERRMVSIVTHNCDPGAPAATAATAADEDMFRIHWSTNQS